MTFLRTSSASHLPKAGLLWILPTISQQPQLPWLLCLSCWGFQWLTLKESSQSSGASAAQIPRTAAASVPHLTHHRTFQSGYHDHGSSHFTFNYLNDYPAVSLQKTPKVICSSLNFVLFSFFMKEQLPKPTCLKALDLAKRSAHTRSQPSPRWLCM